VRPVAPNLFDAIGAASLNSIPPVTPTGLLRLRRSVCSTARTAIRPTERSLRRFLSCHRGGSRCRRSRSVNRDTMAGLREMDTYGETGAAKTQ
jgi:hypothetical protein